MPRGVFVAVEGGEGAGKSSIAASLTERLREHGHQVLSTREPGGTPEGLALRALLLGAQGETWDPWAELLLMAAARVQHVRRVIAPALASGTVVVCDRFIGSTIAYQSAGRGLPAASIAALHSATTGGLLPDLTLVLDVDPASGLRRSQVKLETLGLDEGRFERLGLDFHCRVRESFIAQAEAAPARHRLLNADRPITLIQDQAWRAVQAVLSGTTGGCA